MVNTFSKSYSYETNYFKVFFYDINKNYIKEYKSYDNNAMITISNGLNPIKINNNHEFYLDSSEFIILPPNNSLEIKAKADITAIIYEISPSLIEESENNIKYDFSNNILTNQGNIVKRKLYSEIKSNIYRINRYCMSNNKNRAYLIDLYSQELVYHLVANNFIFSNYLNNYTDPVIYTINYLKENVLQPIKIKEIAADLNMSPSNLTLSFKKRVNMTPKEYQNLLKLKVSKEQLRYKNVTEVSYELGFDNISYFIKLFKNYFGETPKRFSKRIRES